ncbi:MAG: cupin domain-containing protein, partial [Candidatus Dormibacteraceae bacterium]
MSVGRIVIGEREHRQPAPGGPVVEVVIGAEDGWPVGLVQVTVPAGGGMPAHDHGASATLLIPLSGALRLVAEESGEATELEAGVVATIPVGQRVRLENAGDGEARLLAVLAPADFAAVAARWPERQRPDVLDARTLPPARRHAAIFERLDG